MKNIAILIALMVLLLAPKHSCYAQDQAPDTVLAGIYINSIHNIDFKQKEFAISCWLWLRYNNRDFDFVQNLEIPSAKSVTKSFSTVDTSDGDVYLLMKLDCVMKDSWKINNFPFDKQSLRFNIENSQYDSSELVFKPDTTGSHFDAKYTIRGWKVDSLLITNGIKTYETAFGDKHITDKQTQYSNFKVKMVISRDATGLFWKMFLGMYIALMIAYMCFYIHADSIDSRFGLSVGALFAVVGNKYVVESSLPESNSFTLVDSLHGLTLLFILLTIMSNAISLRLVKAYGIKSANRFDFMMAQAMLLIYIIANVYLINAAAAGGK
jgi:hypothetical protein